MRRRILQSTVTVAVVAVLLLGVPLAVAASLVARQGAERATMRVADTVANKVITRLDPNQPQPLDTSVFEGVDEDYHVSVRLENGDVLQRGTPPRRPIEGKREGNAGDFTFVVVAQQPSSAAYPSMLRAALAVLLVAFLADIAAVILGLRQAQRLAEPLVDLAQRARRLGSGHGVKARFARYDVEEVDRVADVLERSAERMNAMLAAERQFASDASHQLRTPLTALSMRLEEILHTNDPEVVREEARIALDQVERLAGTVDHLLSRTRKQRAATAVPLQIDDVIAQQEEEWKPAFANAGRHLRVAGTRGLWCCATPGGISQIVATLLENSLVHGAGTVTVRARWSGGSVVVEVGDEGPGVPPDMAPLIFERSVSTRESTGLGLALARDLAEADGGRLALVQLRPAVFALFLNVPDGWEPRRGRLRKAA